MNYRIVTDAGFPHGLRCLDCDRLIREGEPYTDRDGDLFPELVCVACGEKEQR